MRVPRLSAIVLAAALPLAALAASAADTAEPTARVVCLGDSITRAGYPEALSALLGGATVVNAGVGGHPSRAGRARLEKDALALRPEVVVILFGTNDLRADAPQVYATPEAYASNLRAMVDACRKAGAKPVLATLPPIDEAAFFTRHERAPFTERGGLPTMVRAYQDAAAGVARDRNVPLVDLHADLTASPDWRSPDGVHPTAGGSRQIARHVARVVAPLLGLPLPLPAPVRPIDRRALVTRHNVVLTRFDGERPLQVGNGEFAFGMDVTGLQTFAPFNTLSHWGWHSSALPVGGQAPGEFAGQVWDTHGRPVRYPMPDPQRPELSAWLAANPHRIHLGRVGLVLTRKDGTPANEGDLRDVYQTLDLWTGVVTSRFTLEDQPVTVTTACHPTLDLVAVRVESPLIRAGRLAVFLAVPGNNPLPFANHVGDWSQPGRFEHRGPEQTGRADFERRIDDTVYHVRLAWQGDADLRQAGADTPVPEQRNRVTLHPAAAASDTLSFVCAFSPKALPDRLPDAGVTFAACRQQWPAFWKRGGAIDLSESADPRWKELERRVVLSQYLMKVNEAGSLPPQESGLVNNGWYGRFHLEMVWWHAAHWALWNRWPEPERGVGVGFYERLLDGARQRAKEQGYRGARWPKCIGPDGREWPHEIHALLIWQQPHPIFFAELDYRAHPTRATLEKWQPVVEATADFLASYAFFEEKTRRYVLGPPVHVVSENTDPKKTRNPAFELGYWRFGLRTAQQWRTRLGLPRRAEWDRVLGGLSPLPEQDGVYVLHEGVSEMWTKFNFEHPALTGAFGMLPGDGVDLPTMRRTLDRVRATWKFERTWGWDFPMLAMCAARLGETERALDFLLHPASGFQFDARGLATGGPFPYFPSNGGLLYAVAMLAAGWDGAPGRHAPGFPDNGQWTVRWENLSPAP